VFNASKSKCLVVAHKGRRHLLTDGSICPFYVGGNQIEFVDQFVHLGHVIDSKGRYTLPVRTGRKERPFVRPVRTGVIFCARTYGP